MRSTAILSLTLLCWSCCCTLHLNCFLHQLPLESVRKPEFWPDYHPSSSEPSSAVPKQGSDFPANLLLDVAGSRVVLGKPDDYPSFGFDNEYGRKEIQVRSGVCSLLQV